MKRLAIILLATAAIAAFIVTAENARTPTECEQCGAQLAPLGDEGRYFKCTKCEFMLDSAFVPPAPQQQ